MLQVYEGEGKTADECHFLGEFELSGIPPLPKNESRIETTFKIDSNGILSVNASYGSMQKSLKLDVYSKSGGMTDKTIERLSLRLNKLMIPDSKNQPKCEILEDATRMSVIPKKRNKSNVLKLYVESEVKLTPLESSIYPYLGFILVKLCHMRTQGYHMIIIIIIILIVIITTSSSSSHHHHRHHHHQHHQHHHHHHHHQRREVVQWSE